jgi:hypothetical protein
MANPQDPSELEAWVHKELRTLPELEAPAPLRAGVWARLNAEAARPWWRRSWWHWPKGVRMAAALPLTALVILFALGPWLVERYLPGSGLVLAPLSARVIDLIGVFGAVGRALWLVAESLSDNLWHRGAVGLVFMAYFWFVGVGTFFVRYAQRRTRWGNRE